MKIVQATQKVYNFHKENWTDIIKAVLTNFTYSFAANSVPTFISLKWDLGVLISQGFYYMFLVILFSRDKYTTVYGKVIFFLSCVSGGFTGYMISKEIVKMLN